MTAYNSKKHGKQPLLRYKIGKELRNIRKYRGYTQLQLATMMGISRSTVSKIENGGFAMSLDNLEQLASYLKFEIIIKTRQSLP